MRVTPRNRIIFITFFVLLFFSNICLAENPAAFLGEVTGDNTNVRADSTVNSEIICRLSRGYKVQVVSELYEWYKIRLPIMAPSYIKKNLVECIRYLEPSQVSSELYNSRVRECTHAKVLGNRVNIRLRPDESSPILGTIDSNEFIQVAKEQGEWLKIIPIQNSFGWVHNNLVKKYSEGAQKITLETGKTLPADENTTVEGIIKPKFITGIATHKLITKDKDIFLLKADKAGLDALNFKKVKIIGKVIQPKSTGYTILEVKIMEVIN
ncbi:MAG: SH3 domain-containing protein [Candidatus Omnitrophica bacterium]|nr:SH3 domain-containing protein [Candidatus Omnitrophota bacterium]